MLQQALLLFLGTAIFTADQVLGSEPQKCSSSNPCPKEAPCCSQYGQCGVGAYCLGGCDPRASFSIDSCAPAPVCQSRTMKMDNLDKIVDVGKYLGDSSKVDWVSQGEVVPYNGNLLLTMPPRSVGTVLATTVYVWYGNIKARLRTSRGKGVVTAFILLSDVQDEIDFEFVGTQLGSTQSNFYFQGITDYTHSSNVSVSDTFENFHDYEIRWTPNSITWLVDGQMKRQLKKSDTWDAENNRWKFPQTPARVQISIWPGGADSNQPGTINWAGGPIDWENHPDIKSPGYYYATFSEVSIECYNSSDAPGTNHGVSYTYSDLRATNDTVVDGDKPTVLSSFFATGLDMHKGGGKGISNGNVATVPGFSSSGSGATAQAVGGAAGPPDNGSSNKANCPADRFVANCGPNGVKSSATTLRLSRAITLTVLAAVIIIFS